MGDIVRGLKMRVASTFVKISRLVLSGYVIYGQAWLGVEVPDENPEIVKKFYIY